MMAKSLIGQRIFIRGNEFSDQDLSALVAVVDENNQKILLEFDNPLVSNSTSYSRAVASPRLSKDSVNSLLVDGVLGCSVTWVPDGRFNSSEPMDLSWWRGGAAAVTDLYTVQNQPCVDCGNIANRQVADHKTPLVKEYYETGTIDKTKMRSLDAAQPQCPTCSARQGAEMSRYSRQQKKDLGL